MRNPIRLLLRAIGLWLNGRARFGCVLAGNRLEHRGEAFMAFRKVVVAPGPQQPNHPGAYFRVRFRFKNLSVTVNRLLSLIPIPLIIAQPGFRSKTWLLGAESGDFLGYYEFDTAAAAEAYWDSLPLALMRRRAAEGSLSHEVIRVSPEKR